MTLIVRPGILYDADALAYMELVKAADAAAGQTGGLEQGVIDAINDFVVGCKTDGIWSAIKASCILAGARTLAGALIPLVGTAPTNFNFVSGDYNRKTGLVGNGSTKYLNSNRNNNADPQNSKHLAVWRSTAASGDGGLLGSGNSTGDSSLYTGFGLFIQYMNDIGDSTLSSGATPSTTFYGASRAVSNQYVTRFGGSNYSISKNSVTPLNKTILVYQAAGFTNARLAFYSIGESLNLAALDARVTALITAIGVAIP